MQVQPMEKQLDSILHNITATTFQKRDCQIEYEKRINEFDTQLKVLCDEYNQLNMFLELNCK
jgi:hypothetical protein